MIRNPHHLQQVNLDLSMNSFLGVRGIIGVSQGDEHLQMLKFSCCRHMTSCKEKCVPPHRVTIYEKEKEKIKEVLSTHIVMLVIVMLVM